jgi:uncharacterized protein YycO
MITQLAGLQFSVNKMDTVALLFSTSHSPFSWLIRALTWSRWSHVSIVDGDTIIQAHALHGVIRTLYAEALAADADYEMVRVHCHDPEAVIAAASSQIGKKYDWFALVGFILRRDWQAEDKWFCSELVAWAFQQARQPLFRPEAMRRITPEDLWRIAI